MQPPYQFTTRLPAGAMSECPLVDGGPRDYGGSDLHVDLSCELCIYYDAVLHTPHQHPFIDGDCCITIVFYGRYGNLATKALTPLLKGWGSSKGGGVRHLLLVVLLIVALLMLQATWGDCRLAGWQGASCTTARLHEAKQEQAPRRRGRPGMGGRCS